MTLPNIIYFLASISGIVVVGIIIAMIKENKPSEKQSTVDQAQARKILVQAELAGIKEVARSKHDTEKLEDVFEDHLEKTSLKIEQQYVNLFKKTEAFVTNQIQDNQQRIVNQLDMLSKEAEKTINTQSEAAREELNNRMEKEFDATKQLIRDYKKKRMEFIDREIFNIVARTIKQTLGKALSKKDHADLVYRALDQAKKDGFFNEPNAKT